MTPLSDIEALYVAVKNLRSERIKAERLSLKAAQRGMSPKQSQKASVDLSWQAMHVAKLEADVHAAAVDAGIADLREPDHYRERTVRPSGWHEYLVIPAKPRCLTDRKEPR